MDKYTVDLDQVLNDFEYSELTDQYSNASTRIATGSTALPIQNNVTKHSINNVFHSLNEYLNTSINVNSLNQIDNNILENKNNCTGEVLSIGQNHFKIAEKSIKDFNLKTDELLLDFSENNNVSVNDDVKFFVKTSESEDSECTKIETSGSKDSDCKKIEDNCVGVKKEDIYVEGTAESVEDREKCKNKIEGNAEDDGIEIKDQSLESDSEDKEVCADNVHKVEEKEESIESEIKIEKGVEQLLDNSQVVEEPVQEVVTAFIEAEKKVGFSEDIDLDDSEITKLLEELETEDMEVNNESQNVLPTGDGCENVEETKENESCDITVQDEETPVGDTMIEKVEVEENKDDLPVNIDKVGDKIEECVEQSLSDLGAGDSNKYIDVKQEKMGAIGGSIGESDVLKEIDEVEKSSDVTREILDKEKSVEVPEEKVVTENNCLEIHKDTSEDSLSRPQDLQLIVEREEPKRKINLIGDPGSTPYNNVYVNKEIPRNKDKEYDSDTDYSTSSSPTFSDASSTASTASIDESHTEDNRNPVNPPIEKNGNETTVESEELSQTTSKMENTTSTESPTSETADPTLEIDNPTSEPENPTSEPAPTVSGSSGDVAEGSFEPGAAAASDSGSQEVENMGETNLGKQWLGKEAPLWIPDSDATSCLHCDMKFTVLKRRHHCRACGLVLCSKCCHLRFRLEYLDAEARVCNKCHDILNKDTNSSSGSDLSPEQGNSPLHRPNPNNPSEYCSTVSPLEQTAGANPNPPAVMVPVGVLKRKGSNKAKSNKSVMFCDGIRPGSDLTNLDNDFDYNNTKTKKPDKSNKAPPKANKNLPSIDPQTNTFIPSSESSLPPTVIVCKTDISYYECSNGPKVVETLKNEQLTFAIDVNLYVHLKIIDMNCCINKMAWCFSTEGLINVGQDEIVILLEYIDEESFVPKDVFYHISNIYNDAVKGNSVKKLGLSLHNASNFLDSKNHAGFVYIRPTFQCLEKVIKPKDPYLIGILIHRWETPWAKLFPLRLILRLGAEYRYYPSPIISTRHRESVFVEIGHTIINLLADFRNFSYTLPQIRGLTIHMEDKNTTVTIPVNRYDQVMKSINNSSDHILAFAGNFSLAADSHLVCIQDTQGNENCYSTHAINIHNKPRKITGASFIVFNGALKSSSGLTAKSNIVEDGLMIQVLPEHMQQIRESLRAMKNHTISCGCVNAASDETVNIVWGENDVNFNIGIVSAIDNTPLSGVPSIRVHNGKNHVCVNGSRLIRWTEVFIVKSGDDNPKGQDPVDVSRISEGIAKATCDALVKYLDLLIANGCQKIGIRTTLHVDNVSYLAGSNGGKLAPIYMKSLDDELIPVLHRITTNNLGDSAIVLELIFRILNV